MKLPKYLATTTLTLGTLLVTSCGNGGSNVTFVKFATPNGDPICVNEKAIIYKELSKNNELASAEFIVKTPGGRELLGRYSPNKNLSGPGYKRSRIRQNEAISLRGLSRDTVHTNLFGVRTGYELEHLTLYHSNDYKNTRAWFLTNEAASCAFVAQGEIPCHVFFEVNSDRVMVQLPYKLLGNYRKLENVIKESYFKDGNAC